MNEPFNQLPTCDIREGGAAAERVERQIEHLKCEQSFIRARDALNAAAGADRLLSYNEYKNANLDARVRRQFEDMQNNMMHGLNRLTWTAAQFIVGGELRRVNAVLGREGLPEIDRAFLNAAVDSRLRHRARD